jgi:hypothetical protein
MIPDRLLSIVGEQVLERAVADIKPLIKADEALLQQPVARIAALLADADYEQARNSLPSYCAVVRPQPADAQKDIADQIVAVDKLSVSNEIKTLLLGIILLRQYGTELVDLAVRDLKPQLLVRSDASSPSEVARNNQAAAATQDQNPPINRT